MFTSQLDSLYEVALLLTAPNGEELYLDGGCYPYVWLAFDTTAQRTHAV